MGDDESVVSLADVFRRLPPDVVDRNVLAFLDKLSRRSLKLASREVAGLVRACRGSVTIDLVRNSTPTASLLVQQALILRQYTFASELKLCVGNGQVVAVLVSSYLGACTVVGPVTPTRSVTALCSMHDICLWVCM